MINAFLLESRLKDQKAKTLQDQRAEVNEQQHRMKTDRMADKHYKRVSSFAKEMLVRPHEIDIHRINNPHNAYQESVRGQPMTFRQQPMKFGGHATGTERLAEVIIRN